jgi:D-serine deaminase-like pyridoxal phosphate-dependent protein
MNRLDRLDEELYRLPPQVTKQLLTPALLVFLDQVRTNVRRIVDRLGGDADRWRVHVKTTKIPEVWSELIRAGLRNFKCATLREARVLLGVLDDAAARGADLLVAYPHVPPALGHLGMLAREHPDVALSVLCEDASTLSTIPEELSVFVDVNCGMDRTGVALRNRDQIFDLVRRCGPRFRGLHVYEGQVHAGSAEDRRRLTDPLYERVADLASALRRAGIPPFELVTSGTPSFTCALEFAALSQFDGVIHRVSPGTVVFHDLHTEETLDELELAPAALVLSRVISHPRPDMITTDAGAKSLAAEAPDPCAKALGHPELRALRPSEEHLPFEVLGGWPPARGTPLFLVPRHVCPTVNLAESAVLIEDGRIAAIAPVAARAHDVELE